uniref:Alkaline phosphatase n=1 Tax=Anaerolinea thermolimosa TaxID=229919 RepID=A0A7C4PMW6_9CHLR
MMKKRFVMKEGLSFLLVMWVVLGLALFTAQAKDAKPKETKSKDAKYIILVIGDGMNIEHEIAASRYLYGGDFELSFHKLPYQANVATWDVTTYNYWCPRTPYNPNVINPKCGYDPAIGGKEPYPLGPELPDAKAYHIVKATDSASAATAWATGYKTDDGNIAWLPGDPDSGGNRNNDGTLKTIAEWLRELKGYAIGVVSTVPFSHATPAAHVSHNKSRNNYHAISEEILKGVKPEVVIGAGYPAGSSCSNTKSSTYISNDAYDAVCADNSYLVVTRAINVDGGIAILQAAQEAVARGKKLFGLFGGDGGHFESLTPQDLPQTPLVTQATRENPTFAEATLAALKVLSQDPDGFFLIAEQGDIDWANHANDFRRMVGTMKDLHDGVQAVIDFVNQPDDDIDWSNTLLIVHSDHSNSYMRNQVKLGAGDLPIQNGPPYTYPGGEVTYGSTNHTNELTRLYATGANINKFKKYEGKWYPGTRILDNTQLFHMMMEAAGVPMDSPLRLEPGSKGKD